MRAPDFVVIRYFMTSYVKGYSHIVYSYFVEHVPSCLQASSFVWEGVYVVPQGVTFTSE
jgi:hypothetical protein